MDAQEIRALLGKSIFERAQKYRKRILQSSCTILLWGEKDGDG